MTDIQRRDFLKGTLATAAALGVTMDTYGQDQAPLVPGLPQEIIDTNVYLSRWPFRRLRGDSTEELLTLLRRHNIHQAWVGSFDGLFHKDVAAVNTQLAEQCREHGRGRLVPFGTVNPKLPDWEEELRRCREVHRMPGIRLHPNYHRYTLDDPAFVKLLQMAAEHRLIVQLAAWMEDERTQSSLMLVPEVDLTPLPQILPELPHLKLVLLNGFRIVRGSVLREVLNFRQVFCDIGMLDVLDGLAELLETIPAERVLFGSYAPMFPWESTLLKFAESIVSEESTRLICQTNARRLLLETQKEEDR